MSALRAAAALGLALGSFSVALAIVGAFVFIGCLLLSAALLYASVADKFFAPSGATRRHSTPAINARLLAAGGCVGRAPRRPRAISRLFGARS